ncbi:MAG: DUF2235 domain-containing protein [Pseudomonadota bacterium]
MPVRPPMTHVFVLDGTLTRLEDGHESNAGLVYKLLAEGGPRAGLRVGYDPGIQGNWIDMAAGTTINRSILAGYAWLASRYLPGDQIHLFGYSRGAYAARSLSGMIGRLGLLRRRHATERRVLRAFRYYEAGAGGRHATLFRDKFCRADVPISFIGVWDTVAALGLPYPLISRLAPMATEFHDDRLGHHVTHAAHALAIDETRTAFRPILWRREEGWDGRLSQMWFPGRHSDVGGQNGGRDDIRPLSNLALVWMLERASAAGLTLPSGWRSRFPTDAAAPMRGARAGYAKYFLFRAPRRIGLCASEEVHPSVAARSAARPGYRPRGRLVKGEAQRGSWEEPATRTPAR